MKEKIKEKGLFQSFFLREGSCRKQTPGKRREKARRTKGTSTILPPSRLRRRNAALTGERRRVGGKSFLRGLPSPKTNTQVEKKKQKVPSEKDKHPGKGRSPSKRGNFLSEGREHEARSEVTGEKKGLHSRKGRSFLTRGKGKEAVVPGLRTKEGKRSCARHTKTLLRS